MENTLLQVNFNRVDKSRRTCINTSNRKTCNKGYCGEEKFVMPKKKVKSGNLHRLVVECDKAQFIRFRAALLEQRGMTVSNWARLEMDKVLNEPVRGKFKTKYLK